MNNNKLFKSIFIIFFYFPIVLFSQITITENISKLDNFSLGYYHDKNQEFNITKIENIEFDKEVNNKFTFGYIKGDSWFRLNIDNQSKNSKFIIYLSEPYFNEVNLYSKSSDGWQKQTSGLALFLKNKNSIDINPRFILDIEPNSQKTFYIQLHTKSKETMVNFGEFIIYTQEAFVIQNIFSDFILYAFYFGTMFVIIIFNLSIFIALRETIYLYYLAYIFFSSIYVLAYSGFAYYMGLAQWHSQLNISVPLFIIFFTLFSRSFLKTAIYTPIIDKILKVALWIVIILIPLIIIDYDPWFGITTQVITPFVPFLILASIIIFLKGVVDVKYYIFALVLYMISMMILSLMTQGVIANSDFNHYSFIFGLYIEALLFFFVLANRFYKTQQELIRVKEHQKEVLEEGIKKKTGKISQLLENNRLLLKELNHRVKNNFQMVISLLWIESSKDKSKDYKSSFLDLINRIRAISLIHEYLLENQTYSQINSQEYLSKIINEIIQIHSKDNLNIQTQIDSCLLEMQEAMSLGIIINEVLNNSIKYHNSIERCDIKFSFKLFDDKTILTIKDNGQGFDLNKRNKGFGLKMIDEFARKLKSHSLEYRFDNGTIFVLTFT